MARDLHDPRRMSPQGPNQDIQDGTRVVRVFVNQDALRAWLSSGCQEIRPTLRPLTAAEKTVKAATQGAKAEEVRG